MKIRQVEKLFAIVLAVLCCGLGVQLRISLKENEARNRRLPGKGYNRRTGTTARGYMI